MSDPTCGLCGKPATGLASINEQRYCHGDEFSSAPSCYMRASWAMSDGYTIDVGYVHVLTDEGGVCTDACPHPDHKEGSDE